MHEKSGARETEAQRAGAGRAHLTGRLIIAVMGGLMGEGTYLLVRDGCVPRLRFPPPAWGHGGGYILFPWPNWLAKQMHLRVVIEGLGYVGLIEVLSPTLTLSQLRAVLSQTFDVDALPRNYMFLAPSGSAIGMRAEPTTLAWSLRPSITLLPTSESPLIGA